MRSAGALAVAGAGVLAYARWEAASYRLRMVDAGPLPRGTGSLRILHLSDLHMTPRRRRLQEWVSGLRRLDPDLIVITGDFLAHPHAVSPTMRALEPLFDLPGVFVLGSNDYYAPHPINPFMYFAGPSDLRQDRPELPWPELVSRLESVGWQHLPNRRSLVRAAGLTIDVRGVDDPHIGRDDYPAIAGATSAEADLSLGVAHAPYLRVLDGFATDHVDVALAGHTHGGQVCLPGIGALVTNCDLDRRRARGLSRHPSDRGSMRLHVSAGLGTSPYAPIRLACPPEATLLTLSRRG